MRANAHVISHGGINAHALRSVDFVLIILGYLLGDATAAILNVYGLFRYPSAEDWSALPVTLIPIALLSWSAVSAFGNTYTLQRYTSPALVILSFLRALGLWGVMMLGLVFLAKLKYSSRQFTMEFILSAGLLMLAREFVTVLALRHLGRRGKRKTVLIIGEKSNCDKFMALTALTSLPGYHTIAAIVTAGGDVTTQSEDEPADLMAADEMFVIGASPHSDSQQHLAIQFLKEAKPVHFIPQLFDARLFRHTFGEIAGLPMLSITPGRLTKIEASAKRTFDLVGALALLVLSAPIWLATAALIKLTSPGPVLFRQKRLGRSGRPFTLFKFRTMRIDAEQELLRSPELHRLYLLNNYKLPPGKDPRLIPVGAFLRALSIDELPQLLNVIRGEMSLVGPRPIVPLEIEKYGEFASWFLSVKPGLTGQWQVSGRSEIQEYGKRIELDMEYIRDQSLRTDFEILLRTVPSVIRRKGAY